MLKRTRARARRLLSFAAGAALLTALLAAPSCMRRTAVTHVPSEIATPTGQVRPVRVLLMEGVQSASVSIASPYTVEPWGERAPGTPPVLARCPALANGAVRITPAAIIVGNRHFPDDAVLLNVAAPAALTVDGRRYRGSLALRRTASEQMAVINVLPLEDYLYGVLGGETYAAWPAAALDAQAIVARSYAMWRMAQRRDGFFDLYATVKDQNYLGMAREDPRLAAAVDRTAGIVLLYQMKLFRCYYHSTCGGHTESVQDVFPDPPLLPLSGVPCGHCKASKYYTWKRVIPRADVSKALRRWVRGGRRVTSLEVRRRTASGRALEVAIGVGDGKPLVVRASAFRLAIGPGRLPSTLFDVRKVAGGYEFDGRGFGHGVGMCQWGARGMAEAGFSAAAILRHYYTGAQLHRLYGPRGSI